MGVSREAVAALGFLALSVAYGWHAIYIDMFPGQEYEPFTPRTFPLALAVVGGLLSLVQLVLVIRADTPEQTSWRRYDWGRVGLLIGAMLAYGALLQPFGFLLATVFFLTGGYLILGERRIWVLLGASAGVALVFWGIMTRLLGLYLAPGEIFRGLLW